MWDDLPLWLVGGVAVIALVLVWVSGLLIRRTRQWMVLQTRYEYLQQQQSTDEAQVLSLTQENELLKDQVSELERELIRLQSIQQTQQFNQQGQKSLDEVLRPLREQIERFQQRLNQVHSESVRGQAELGSELRRVMEVGLQMSSEAEHLSQALKGDNKRMGTWGELLLAQTLKTMGLVEGQHFIAQPRYRDAQGQLYIPDFVVNLPNDTHLILDSKASLVDYDRALQAETPEAHAQALNDLVKAFERHADDLAKKNYHALEQLNSPDFVLMFVPIEPAYLAAMSHQPQLFEYGLRKNVIITSHTSLVPILRTIAQIWSLAKSHEHAHELAQQAGSIFSQLNLLADRLRRVGDTINQLTNHYNSSVTALVGQQGVYAKLQRFEQLAPNHLQARPDVQTVHRQVQTQRLKVGSQTDSKAGAVEKDIKNGVEEAAKRDENDAVQVGADEDSNRDA